MTTATDAERDLLLADHARLETELRDTLAAESYPPEALFRIGFSVESEESVTRDGGGNWYHRMK